ncbi:MAG: phage tail family protein [Butyrivibrio sp.]|nr:phage tail family protein [Butyrivibrio sp.]
MVSDRRIIISNGSWSLDITEPPYYVKNTKGFDRLNVNILTSQGFDQDGGTVMNDYIVPRDMEIIGQVKADNPEQMQKIKERIFNLFIPKKKITINHYYGKKNRLITARVESTPEFSFSKVTAVENYTVQLEAADPYWRDVTETMLPIANLIGGLHFPLRIPKQTGVTFGIKNPSLIADAYNYSAVKIGMRFVFIANGTVTNPQLFNINTREFLKLNCVMEPGEKITVQTGYDKTVTRNKQGIESDYIGKIDIAGGGNTFLELEPGDNLLRYGADNGENLLEMKIYYQNKHLGV